MNATSNSALVKNLAQKHGFSFCGISEAKFLEDEAPRLDAWLNKGYHGKMSYMENHFDKRLDPTKLVPGAKSVVSLIYNYYPEKELDNKKYKIAKYAYGTDYHFIVKDKLKSIIHELQNQLGQIEGRVFVDSAPILERVWAAESGLGWIGKNSLLLNKNLGSFFFLAELIIDLELEPDGPVKDYCGSCTRCIDACPTDAIVGPMVLDSNKCISYLTIELKDEIPENFKDDMEGWVFGCDICQDVCPWNRFSKPHDQPEFMPSESLAMDSQQWEELTQEVFSKVFKKSAVKRTKFAGLQRNIDFLKNMKPD